MSPAPSGPAEAGPKPACTLQIVRGDALDLDLLEPLWWSLLEWHTALRPELPARTRAASWPRRRAQYERSLASPGSFVALARRGPELVGYALVEIKEPDETFVTGPIADVHTLVVAPGERGTGLGSALMDAVDAELERLGVDDLLIDYLAGNGAAARFYERRGFVPFVNQLYARRRDAAPPGPQADDDQEETR
jgi:GNAT superfamily N-acetyltransferase